MNRSRQTSPPRRLIRLAAIALASLALITALSSCGGPDAADAAPYLGTWQRVEGGEPNPAFTLTIAGRDDATDVTFANHGNGMSQTVPATVEDDGLVCAFPTGDDLESDPDATSPLSPAPGSPAESDVRLTLDENGQLVVDVVLDDGTLEPIWIYERAPVAAGP